MMSTFAFKGDARYPLSRFFSAPLIFSFSFPPRTKAFTRHPNPLASISSPRESMLGLSPPWASKEPGTLVNGRHVGVIRITLLSLRFFFPSSSYRIAPRPCSAWVGYHRAKPFVVPVPSLVGVELTYQAAPPPVIVFRRELFSKIHFPPNR